MIQGWDVIYICLLDPHVDILHFSSFFLFSSSISLRTIHLNMQFLGPWSLCTLVPVLNVWHPGQGVIPLKATPLIALS